MKKYTSKTHDGFKEIETTIRQEEIETSRQENKDPARTTGETTTPADQTTNGLRDMKIVRKDTAFVSGRTRRTEMEKSHDATSAIQSITGQQTVLIENREIKIPC
jgi:hypothetical protein